MARDEVLHAISIKCQYVCVHVVPPKAPFDGETIIMAAVLLAVKQQAVYISIRPVAAMNTKSGGSLKDTESVRRRVCSKSCGD